MGEEEDYGRSHFTDVETEAPRSQSEGHTASPPSFWAVDFGVLGMEGSSCRGSEWCVVHGLQQLGHPPPLEGGGEPRQQLVAGTRPGGKGLGLCRAPPLSFRSLGSGWP